MPQQTSSSSPSPPAAASWTNTVTEYTALALAIAIFVTVLVRRYFKPLWGLLRQAPNVRKEFSRLSIYKVYDHLAKILSTIGADIATLYLVVLGDEPYITRIASTNLYTASTGKIEKAVLDYSHIQLLSAMHLRSTVCYTGNELEDLQGETAFVAHQENLAGLVAMDLFSENYRVYFVAFKFATKTKQSDEQENVRQQFKRYEDYLERERPVLIDLTRSWLAKN